MQEANKSSTRNRMFDSNISQGTGSIKYKNACEGITKKKRKAAFVYRGGIKNDRKERDQGRAGKKSRQYIEWEQRGRACIFSVGRRNGRSGRNGKR